MSDTSNSDPNQRLKVLVDRIERLAEEKDAIASDIKDIFVEAKDNGYDPAVLAAALMRRKKRRKDPAKLEAFDAMLDSYEAALG